MDNNLTKKLYSKNNGFTLIELSIVLVIIGLVAGGVLVGRDLIKAAELRSIVSQKEKFHTAAITFKGKYNQLPGDMKSDLAYELDFFYFTGPYNGTSVANEDGIISGMPSHVKCSGECGAFWRHLSQAGLIEGSYGETLIDDTSLEIPGSIRYSGSPPQLDADPLNFPNVDQSIYMPATKSGTAFWGVGNLLNWGVGNPYRNFFYIGVKDPNISYKNKPVLSPIDTESLDKKLDDGRPNTGQILITTRSPISGPGTYWDTTSRESVCIYGGANYDDNEARYNLDPATGGNNITCQPIFIW